MLSRFRMGQLTVVKRNSTRVVGSGGGGANKTSSPTSLRAAVTMTRSSSSSTLFQKWHTPVVIANGDYREEAWLESHIGGPLYEHQASLPRLPVPQIADTLEKFVPTALPLARNPTEAQHLQAAVQQFPRQAAHLQERLLERASPQGEYRDSSWLQHWWNTLGYLQVRDPVTVNVSYFFQFADDPTVTPRTSMVDHMATVASSPMTQRGAAMLTAAAHYRRQVCSGQLPAERIGRPGKETMLCSVAFKYMFHATRIPQLVQDAVELHDPSLHTHVIVARKGHFFAMDFVDPVTGWPYPAPLLQRGLQDCVDWAERLPPRPLLGYLTSSNRDDWATARTALLEQGGSLMQEALHTLQSGALVICLDEVALQGNEECAEWCLHGSLHSGHNRWFDKSIQVICSETGKAAYVGEHSMMDGMPVVGLADQMTKLTWQAACDSAQVATNVTNCNVRPVFEEAFANMATQRIESLVQKAKEDFADLATKHEISVQRFQGYGSNFIKQAGFSPDAYVQMAMQLATYRLWGEQVGTYEATQVRPFLHGRTETTRSVSTESAGFVQRMGLRPLRDENDTIARKDKFAKLQAAVNAHVKYIGNAAKAQGVDRHFLGLSLLVKDGETAPDLYADPVFVRSKRWRVSTSHLTHPKFDNWGYGEVFPDGVGLSYSIHKRHCVFNVTALKEHGWTSKLTQLLEESLLEMRTLIELEQAASAPPQSKL